MRVRVAALLMMVMVAGPVFAQAPTSVAPIPGDSPLPIDVFATQAPIVKDLRRFNQSGSQCVWVTIEALAAFNQAKKAVGISATYRSGANPPDVEAALRQRGVKFLQRPGRDLDFIEHWVTVQGRGVGIGVYGGRHMLALIHFERGKLVKVFDNDASLKVQTWDWQTFLNRFSGWVLVILPDDYPLPPPVRPIANDRQLSVAPAVETPVPVRRFFWRFR